MAEISWNGSEENNQEMILTTADLMAEAANRSVATRLAYLGVRSRKAAENSAQQEVRVETTGKIPTAAMVKARRRCWVEETILLGLFVFSFFFLG